MKLLNCNKNAAILFLALVAFALVSFNVYLLGNLQRKEKWESERRPVKYTVELPKLNLDYKSLPADSSGQYKIQLKFLRPKIRSRVNQFDVSLVTHCTSNHLHYLLDLVNHWKGPISLAVFVPGHDIVSAFRSLHGIYQCSEAFRDRITVHLVYPTSHPPAGNVLKPHLEQALRQLQGSCKEIVARLRNKKEEQKEAWNYANVKVPYPNNLLRNVGRSSISQMSYVFVVDVDLLCNGNLYHGFLQLAEHLKLALNNNDKRVFVVPAFESADKLPPSLSKRDLIKLWDAETVRPFYYKACWKCQRHLGYDAWRSFHSSGSGLQVAYTVEWKDPWEPFYIGPNSVPRYDERFKQYGFNRISQVCETHFAGYDFVILDDAFVIHHGLKPKEGFHSSKNEENSKNREIFRTFKKELRSKYPQSTRHC